MAGWTQSGQKESPLIGLGGLGGYIGLLSKVRDRSETCINHTTPSPITTNSHHLFGTYCDGSVLTPLCVFLVHHSVGTLILFILKAEIQKGELLAQGHRAGCGTVDSDPGLFVYRAHTLYSPIALCSEISPECPLCPSLDKAF